MNLNDDSLLIKKPETEKKQYTVEQVLLAHMQRTADTGLLTKLSFKVPSNVNGAMVPVAVVMMIDSENLKGMRSAIDAAQTPAPTNPHLGEVSLPTTDEGAQPA